MRHLTIRQLQIFALAAETLSFARVAERLRITPAAVSFQIKQIESMSGFALFERMGKKTVLTEAGGALLVYAKTVLQALSDADQAFMGLRGLREGRVTIGLLSTAKYLVPHMLAQFRAQFPGIMIHLREGNRREIIAGVLKGEIELAITGKPPEDAAVIAAPFAPHPSVIIAAPSHPLAKHDRLPPAVLAGEPLIAREEGSGTRALLDQFLRSSGYSARIVMTSSSNETIKQAVMAGMGIALISRHTVGLEFGLDMLRSLPIEGFPLMRSWFVTHRRGMPLLPVHTRLLEFLLKNGVRIIDDLERSYRDLSKQIGRCPQSKTARQARTWRRRTTRANGLSGDFR